MLPDKPEQDAGGSTGGTIQAAEHATTVSPLVSPKFKEFYLSEMARAAEDSLSVPAPDASRTVWDEFDRAQDQWNIELLTRAKALYAVSVDETTIAGVPAAVVTPQGGLPRKNRNRVLVNLHGGGFIVNRGLHFGQLESIPVAALGGFKVITLDYRQGPFHSFPAASEDVEAVYRQLLDDYSPLSIGIYGCSAGGLLERAVRGSACRKRAAVPRCCRGAVDELESAVSGDGSMACGGRFRRLGQSHCGPAVRER